MYKAMKIKENVYWVGAHDFGCRDFHGALFPIQEGTSYNAYLIVDEKITLIDTVEDIYFDVMMERIKDVIGDRPIDHIIVQHAEADHSGKQRGDSFRAAPWGFEHQSSAKLCTDADRMDWE